MEPAVHALPRPASPDTVRRHPGRRDLRQHIDRYVADLGGSRRRPDAARRQARIEFGNIDNVKADCREVRGLRLFDEIHLHLRYATRLLWKAPAFTATSVATLAVCFGACLTIFALVDAILLRPLPFPDPDRLVRIYNTYPRAGVPDDGTSITSYYERRGRLSAFASLAAYRDGAVIVGETGATDATVHYTGHARILLDARHGAAAGTAIHRRGNDVPERRLGDRLVRVLAGALRRQG